MGAMRTVRAFVGEPTEARRYRAQIGEPAAAAAGGGGCGGWWPPADGSTLHKGSVKASGRRVEGGFNLIEGASLCPFVQRQDTVRSRTPVLCCA